MFIVGGIFLVYVVLFIVGFIVGFITDFIVKPICNKIHENLYINLKDFVEVLPAGLLIFLCLWPGIRQFYTFFSEHSIEYCIDAFKE